MSRAPSRARARNTPCPPPHARACLTHLATATQSFGAGMTDVSPETPPKSPGGSDVRGSFKMFRRQNSEKKSKWNLVSSKVTKIATADLFNAEAKTMTLYVHVGGATRLVTREERKLAEAVGPCARLQRSLACIIGDIVDPYCKVFWNGELIGATEVLIDEQNPVWSTTFEVHDVHPTDRRSTLRLEVWDHDDFSMDDFLGECAVSAAELFPKPPATWPETSTFRHLLAKGCSQAVADAAAAAVSGSSVNAIDAAMSASTRALAVDDADVTSSLSLRRIRKAVEEGLEKAICPDAQISFAVIKHKTGVHHVMAEWSLKKHVDSVAKETLGKKGSRSQLAVLAADAGQQRARSASTDASPGAVDLTSTAVEKLANGKREKVRPMPQLVRPWYIFSPRGWTVRHWEVFSLLALVYTAIITPVEVCVLNSKLGGPAYEWALKEVQRANNVVDVVFGLDILLGFLTAYFHDELRIVVTDPRWIAWRYATSWLFLDVVTLVPWERLVEGYPQLRALRIFKLVRLMKLLRVVRANRVLKAAQAQMGFRYAYSNLIKYVLIILMAAHWTACIWSISAGNLGHPLACSWPSNVLRNDKFGVYASCDEVDDEDVYTYWKFSTPFRLYTQAFEFSLFAMTMSYGDAGPCNFGEQMLATCFVIALGCMYAYMVGGVCNIITGMDPPATEYLVTLDLLNQFAAESKLPQPLRERLRDYFAHVRPRFRERHYNSLLSQMSPSLRGEVARVTTAVWVRHVPMFNCEDASERERFVVALALALELESFVPSEQLVHTHDVADRMFIVRKGLVIVGKSDLFGTALVASHAASESSRADFVAQEGLQAAGAGSRRVLGAGRFFGEDMVVNERHTFDATALTFLDTHTLARIALRDILRRGMYPGTRRLIWRHAVTVRFRRRVWDLVETVQKAEAKANGRKVRAGAASRASRDAIKAEIAQLREKGHLLSARREAQRQERECAGERLERLERMGLDAAVLAAREHPMLKIWSGIRALRDKDDDADDGVEATSKAAASSAIRHLQRLRKARGVKPLTTTTALDAVSEDEAAGAAASSAAAFGGFGGGTKVGGGGGGGGVTRAVLDASVAAAESRITARVGKVEEKLDHVAATLTTLVTQLGRQSPPPLGGGATYSA